MLRKLMLLGAMLAMVLAVAAPAMAQNEAGSQYATGCVAVQNAIQEVGDQTATGGDGGDSAAVGGEQDATAAAVQVGVVQVPIGILGDAEADNANAALAENTQYVVSVGGAGGDAANVVALNAQQYQDCESIISQYQAVGDVTEVVEEEAATTTTSGAAAASSGAAAASSGAAAASSGGGGGALPATGGFSLLTLGAGALLVGGGLVARRIVR